MESLNMSFKYTQINFFLDVARNERNTLEVKTIDIIALY